MMGCGNMTRDQTSRKATGDAPATAVIVAHPDDEVLWAGGTILMHPRWRWSVLSLCRASDQDRAPKFAKVMDLLGAVGRMGDLDDGPEQAPLGAELVQNTILSLLPAAKFDLVFTHSPFGEYTRHRRHEETARAVLTLWESGRLSTTELRMFAYKDGHKRHPPRPIASAHQIVELPQGVWQEKYLMLTAIYGYSTDSFEARTTPRKEAFWCFRSPAEAAGWMRERRSEK